MRQKLPVALMDARGGRGRRVRTVARPEGWRMPPLPAGVTAPLADPVQARYQPLALKHAMHHEATWYALWLEARLETVWMRLGMLNLLQLWAEENEGIRDAFTVGEPVRKGRRSGRPVSATPKGNLGRALLRRVEEGLSDAWEDLLAVEAVVAETVQAFDGEEPIHPAARDLLDGVKATGLALARRVGVLREGYAPPGQPDPAVLEMLRKLVRLEDGRA